MHVREQARTPDGPLTVEELIEAAEQFSGRELPQECRFILSTRGKFRRSVVVLECARQGDPLGPERARPAAIAVELLHLASLAHDDVIDEDSTRRGESAARVKFGNVSAGLAGGWLFALAAEIISSYEPHAIEEFASAASRMCRGEMQEVRDAFSVERSRDRYIAIAEQKTASLFESAARLGSSLGGGDAKTVDQLGTYGKNLGIAYQIMDDLVDLLGDGSAGETVGKEIRRGHYTLPIIYAMEEDGSIGEELGPGKASNGVTNVLRRIRSTPAIGQASLDCRRYGALARRSLSGLPAPHHLVAIVDDVIQRAEEAALSCQSSV